jgi:caffeoyl-CoA O-methyltransferase
MADNDSRSGTTRYTTPEILAFVDGTHATHDASLARAFAAPAQHGMPAIQVGISEGKLLTLFTRLAGARKVVEVGTLAGYSALRIARALPTDGKLWTLELEPKHARIAQDNLEAAGLWNRVKVIIGPALASLKTIENEAPFDAVFLDADKEGYLDYARWAHTNLRPGGLLLADNSYYFGKLLEESPGAERMREFHRFVGAHFDSVCIPTPDGLVLGLK